MPSAVEDLIRTKNGAKRNKMVVWEKFSEQTRKYISLGQYIDYNPEFTEILLLILLSIVHMDPSKSSNRVTFSDV